VRYCLERGCSGDVVNKFGLNAVFMAAHCGHHECVELLVTLGKVDASKPIKDGNTPLCTACNAVATQADHPPQQWDQVKAGGLATVKFLLKSVEAGGGGVKPQTDDPAVRADARRPLAMAAHAGCAQVVGLLLEAGADPEGDPEAKDSFPLAAAVSNGHAEVVRALLAAGANAKRLVTVSANERRLTIGLLDLVREGARGHAEVLALLRAADATSTDPSTYGGGAGGQSTGAGAGAESPAGANGAGTGDGGGGKMCANCGASGVKLSWCGGCKSGVRGGVVGLYKLNELTHRPVEELVSKFAFKFNLHLQPGVLRPRVSEDAPPDAQGRMRGGGA
jgi:hypothetical protein